jgi:hypothetical protein
VILLLTIVFQSGVVLGLEDEGQLTWGVNALGLQSPWTRAPSLDDLLRDEEHTVVLDRFYRVGGVTRPATPTECRIAYDQTALFVACRCEEHDMSFPIGLQKADWSSLLGSPGGSDSWPPFPDELDVFVQPDLDDPSTYQFAVTPDGSAFGAWRPLSRDSSASALPDRGARGQKVDAFEASVKRGPGEWTLFLEIPWSSVGGMPAARFGLLPVRTRWRDGEFSSPVAIDFFEWLPVDLFIETDLTGAGAQHSLHTSFCRLPSGVLRWQRPALVSRSDPSTLRQIWQLQSSLSTPTDMRSLARRLYLTQRWTDLLRLEGFNFDPRTGSIAPADLTPADLRQRINAALRRGDTGAASRILDEYLRTLDEVSRRWYADQSPGDILEEEWTKVSAVDRLSLEGSVIRMACRAGGRAVELHLSLPKTGGVRLYGRDEGHFTPAELLPPRVTRTARSWSIRTADGGIAVTRDPFQISFQDAAGREVTRIGDLAFRFDPDGRITATDLRRPLDPDEVIYGFGERYDRFNQNGSVLTLWGMDDWTGNGLGLRNTTYKPVPILHSSRGYMMFDDSSYRLRADVGATDPRELRLTQHGPVFDCYFWTGTPEKALESYTALTGRPILPPRWAFEPWMGRGGEAWESGPLHDAVAEEEAAVARFEALDIPHSALYAEGPSAHSPDLNAFASAHRLKVLSYFMPAVGEAEQAQLMPELDRGRLPILNSGSETATREVAYVDFTNPNARALVRRWWKRDLDLGVAGSMVDYADKVMEDALFCNGKSGRELHNSYSFDYHRTVSEVFRDARGDDFILFGRAAAPGTQRWVGQFAGDHPSNFDGLEAVLKGALNLCACGFSTWGSDLGGYFGFPEPAVHMRWTQLACFSPLMRSHGKAPREPWYFGDEAVANYKRHVWVRENLLDYVYDSAVVAHERGIPIMRSLAVAFPQEPSLAPVADEYMFGRDLLVAPVLREENSRTILFPSGEWTGLWDGMTVSGPTDLTVEVPLNVIPVYLREGAVMPVRLDPQLQFGGSMTAVGQAGAAARLHNGVGALVVTPPKGSETVHPLNAAGEKATVTVRTAGRGFSWMLENLPETDYVLVYGRAAATTVTVDGEVLPRVMPAGLDSMPAGWVGDPAGNRLVIRLPSGARGRGASRTIEVQFS